MRALAGRSAPDSAPRRGLGAGCLLRLVAAAVLALVSGGSWAVEIVDPTGDAGAVAGRLLDLTRVEVESVSGFLTVRGSVAGSSGAIDGDLAAGDLLVPGAASRALAPTYRLAIDLDRNPATGLNSQSSGAIGAEILVDVSVLLRAPTGDPAQGFLRTEPFLAVLLRRYSAGGAALTAQPELLDVPVERGVDGFAVEVPWSVLDGGEPLDLRVVAFLVWDGGSCAPVVCQTATDAAPDMSASPLRVLPEEDVELTFDLEGEELLVPGDVDPRSVEVVYGFGREKAFVWRQNDATDGAEIRLQLFAENDSPATSALRVNASAGMHALPTASIDAAGEVFVFWREEEGTPLATWEGRSAIAVGSSVLGRRFDGLGRQQGSEQVISSGGADDSQAPAAATDAAGNSIVTWRDSDALRVRRLRKSGSGPMITPFHVPLPALVLAGERAAVPQAAASASGDSVVVWQEEANGTQAILARRFDSGGTPKGAAYVVTQSGNPSAPAVGVNDRGDFVIAWESGPGARHIKAQRFRVDATPLGPSFRIHEGPSGEQRFPRIDVNAKGTFVVVWLEIGGNNQSILGKPFRWNQTPLDDVIEIAGPEQGTVPGDPDVAISDDDEVTVGYERRSEDGTPRGLHRRRARLAKRATQPDPPSGGGACVPSETTFCLNGGRFEVKVDWWTIEGLTGVGRAVPGASDTSTNVWFYSPDNWELTVKVLTGCQFTGHYWVFVSSASDLDYVAYDIRVRDTATEHVKLYPSAASDFGRVVDFHAFAGCGNETRLPGRERLDLDYDSLAAPVLLFERRLVPTDSGPTSEAARTRDDRSSRAADSALDTSTCIPSDTTFCLNGGRFEVKVDWWTIEGLNGVGRAVPGASDTSTNVWFYSPDNWELMLKVLTGCSFTGHYWVFASSASDLSYVAYDVRVRDTSTGQSRVYPSSSGSSGRVIDFYAFPGCP